MIRPLRDVEKETILKALLESGSVVEAAQALKIGKTSLYRKIKKYGFVLKINRIIVELSSLNGKPL